MISVETIEPRDVSAATGRRNARKRYWVIPRLQMRLILWVVLVTSLMATTAAWAILMSVWPPMGEGVSWMASSGSMDTLFQNACIRVFVTTGLLVLVFGVIAFLTGLIISHKIAGPLYRIGRVAVHVADGRAGERVFVRKGDYLHEFSQCFNTMLDAVEAREIRSERVLTRIQSITEEVAQSIADGPVSSAQLDARLEEVDRVIRDAQREACCAAREG